MVGLCSIEKKKKKDFKKSILTFIQSLRFAQIQKSSLLLVFSLRSTFKSSDSSISNGSYTNCFSVNSTADTVVSFDIGLWKNVFDI